MDESMWQVLITLMLLDKRLIMCADNHLPILKHLSVAVTNLLESHTHFGQLSTCQIKFTYNWHSSLSLWFTSLNEGVTTRTAETSHLCVMIGASIALSQSQHIGVSHYLPVWLRPESKTNRRLFFSVSSGAVWKPSSHTGTPYDEEVMSFTVLTLDNARSSSTSILTFNIQIKKIIIKKKIYNSLSMKIWVTERPWKHWSWADTSHPDQRRIVKACLQPEHLNNNESVDFLTFFKSLMP